MFNLLFLLFSSTIRFVKKKYIISFLILLVAGYLWFWGGDTPQGSPNQIIHSGVIVAFGDSLTAGHGVDEMVNYPSQLQEKLNQLGYADYKVLNLGKSGDTTRDGLERVDEIFEHNPEIVIVALGANDAFQRAPLKETQANLTKILKKIHEHNAKILLAGIVPPPTRGLGYIGAFEDMYKELARQFDVVLMPSFLSGVMMRSEYNLSDNIHPNQFGYTIVINNLWPYLEVLLRK